MSRRLDLIKAHLNKPETSKSSCQAHKYFKKSIYKKDAAGKTFTREDILKHRERGECYIVLNRKVYDITEFLEEHPGGSEIITDINETDFDEQTREFDEAEHSEEALEDLEEYYRGILVDSRIPGDESQAAFAEADLEADDSDEETLVEVERPLTPAELARTFENKQELYLELIDSYQISHDVMVYRFALEEESHTLCLPIGQHLILSFDEPEGTVTRPYTPVSPYGEAGFIDFLIKLYPMGKMSNHLVSLTYGERIHVKGPKGHVKYHGRGLFTVKKQQRALKRIGMLAGGSGITPMFQILQQIANDPEDNIEVTLLFANKTVQDILLKNLLERIVSRNPNIRVFYTLDKPPKGWNQFCGYISAEMIRQTMPPPSEDSMIFLCGPPPMIKKACIPSLKSLGYQYKAHYYAF